MINIFKKFNLFEWILVVGIITLNIISFIVTKETNWIGIIASITGVMGVVMGAKGHISNYYWAIINIFAYGIVCFQTKFYGEVILDVIYYLPMQFVGIYMWKKHLDKDNIVKTRGLNIKQMVFVTIISIVGILGYGMFLKSINGYLPFFDSTINVLTIIAAYLSVKRFKEQWIIYIVLNIITICMWTIALINNELNSLVMIIMFSFYLANAVYGYINWTKLERSQKNV